MMNNIKNMDDDADKSVLAEIISLMGKMNGEDMDSRKKSYVEVKLDTPPDEDGQMDVKSMELPGEMPSESPEEVKDPELLDDSLREDDMDDSENDMDDDDDLKGMMRSESFLRRKGKIF